MRQCFVDAPADRTGPEDGHPDGPGSREQFLGRDRGDRGGAHGGDVGTGHDGLQALLGEVEDQYGAGGVAEVGTEVGLHGQHRRH
jgi:hypothetical protein